MKSIDPDKVAVYAMMLAAIFFIIASLSYLEISSKCEKRGGVFKPDANLCIKKEAVLK